MYIDDKFQSIIDSLIHAANEVEGGNSAGALAAIKAAKNELDDLWEEVSPSDEPGYPYSDLEELEEAADQAQHIIEDEDELIP